MGNRGKIPLVTGRTSNPTRQVFQSTERARVRRRRSSLWTTKVRARSTVARIATSAATPNPSGKPEFTKSIMSCSRRFALPLPTTPAGRPLRSLESEAS